VLNGIFFVLRTGCQWKRWMPPASAKAQQHKGSTAHSRFQEWLEDGFFARLWEASLQDYDAMKGLDWSWLALDGAMQKAPLGGKNVAEILPTAAKAASTQSLDRSRGHSGGAGD
jgi:transposase